MTLDEIDHLLDLMAKEAVEKGDEAFLPGAISMSADTRARLASQHAPISCTNILHGIRYRGIRVNVARAREDGVANRAEAGDEGLPYFDLEPKA